MKYHLVALFTIFVWGFTFVSTKVLLADISPLWILLLRFVLGLGILCVMRPHILRLKERTDEVLFAAAGATGIAAYYLLENVALVFTTATAVGVIVAASPLFTALISAALGDRSSINIRFFCGFALAMAGLIVVGAGTMGESDLVNFTSFDLFGDMLALTAALVWAVYSTLVARIAQKGYETIAATKRTFVWGVAFILVTTLIFDPHTPQPSVLLDGQNLLNLLFLGAVASAACFVTWGRCREASRSDHNDHLHLPRSRHYSDCLHSYSGRTAECAYNPWLSHNDRRPFAVSKTKREQKDVSCKTDRSVLG